MNLNRYMLSEYKDGARGELINGIPHYDCWGIVRAIRHEVFGLPLMPSWGHISAEDKRGMSHALGEAEALIKPCEAVQGAIACVLHDRVLLHVGIVINTSRCLAVLETTPTSGTRTLPLHVFEQTHCKEGMRIEYLT